MQYIPIERIIKITKDELVYTNDRGESASIDLIACSKSYMAHRIKEQNINPNFNETIRPVGARCFANDYAYYEFYATDHVRFYLKMKNTLWTKMLDKISWNWRRNYFIKFYAIQEMLNSAGYTTLDLT